MERANYFCGVAFGTTHFFSKKSIYTKGKKRMSNYRELLSQREALEVQLALALKVERAEALKQVRELVAQFEFVVDEVFSTKGLKKASVPVAPKYRNPETGVTWSGRGMEPSWIAGKNRAEFEITQNLVQ